ncbi:hypothetical protein CRE_09449 [Caenorhabditis remanei]|uniref:Paired domain-containing protein n=1 Tax=Caenorhabditis remanei TaxID=31234 RepID=E3LIX3_CAERE|nr:hypothetical protein CRE_09449 [Caenorhabditis remanei]
MAPPSRHRSSILNLFKEGVLPVDIIKRLGVPSRTLYNSISRFKKLGTFFDRRGSRRKATVVTPDRIKAVKERIRRNAHRRIRKTAKGMKISRRLLGRIVKDKLKLTCHRERKAAILSEATTKNRLERSKKLLQRTLNGEHLVTVFSDEKLFTVQAEFNPQNHQVLGETYEEAFANGKTIHQASHPAITIAFCRSRSQNQQGSLHFADFRKDISSLGLEALQWTSLGIPTRRCSSTHSQVVATVVRDPFACIHPEGRMASVLARPQSFGLLHLVVLQNKVNAKPHSSIKALKKTLFKEWDALSPDYLRATIDTYPRRLSAVIEKRGGRMEQV